MTRHLLAAALLTLCSAAFARNALVLQTDFGLKDGAVSAMKGVSFAVDSDIRIFDLTHEIPAYNIWEAAYRLHQTAPYWPAGTVFVSVVDPGVGTERKSVVIKSKNGQYFVTPDNGTATLIADTFGVEAVREIDETKNRLQGSEKSYTFHGRDVYAYTGARLAAGKISFEDVGPELGREVTRLSYEKAAFADGVLKGTIPALDVQYGNVWTNIPDRLLEEAGIKYGDTICVKIYKGDAKQYDASMPYVPSFGDVAEGKPLLYLNSLLDVSFALNMENFVATHGIQPGAEWSVNLKKCN